MSGARYFYDVARDEIRKAPFAVEDNQDFNAYVPLPDSMLHSLHAAHRERHQGIRLSQDGQRILDQATQRLSRSIAASCAERAMG